MTTNIEARQEILGGLEPLFVEFAAVVEEIPENAVVRIPYRAGIVADKLAAKRKKLPLDAAFEEFSKVIDEAEYQTVSERSHELVKRGFAGTINNFFERVLVPTEEDTPEALQQEAAQYLKIPEDERKAAKLSQGGYYWGGTFIAFNE